PIKKCSPTRRPPWSANTVRGCAFSRVSTPMPSRPMYACAATADATWPLRRRRSERSRQARCPAALSMRESKTDSRSRRGIGAMPAEAEMVDLAKPPSFRLDGKRALVTGGGRGIGLAAASALAQAGAHVTLAARTRKEIEAAAQAIVARGDKADALQLDVT